MTCTSIMLGGQRAIVCMRTKREKRCKFCRSHADFLCDGHTDATNPETNRPDVCNDLICSQHTTTIGEGKHLCPRCAEVARKLFVELRDRVLNSGEECLLAELPQNAQPWPEIPGKPYLLIQERPRLTLWFVRPGASSVHRLYNTGDLWWLVEQLPISEGT